MKDSSEVPLVYGGMSPELLREKSEFKYHYSLQQKGMYNVQCLELMRFKHMARYNQMLFTYMERAFSASVCNFRSIYG